MKNTRYQKSWVTLQRIRMKIWLFVLFIFSWTKTNVTKWMYKQQPISPYGSHRPCKRRLWNANMVWTLVSFFIHDSHSVLLQPYLQEIKAERGGRCSWKLRFVLAVKCYTDQIRNWVPSSYSILDYEFSFARHHIRHTQVGKMRAVRPLNEMNRNRRCVVWTFSRVETLVIQPHIYRKLIIFTIN